MKHWKLAACVIGVLPLAVMADEPAGGPPAADTATSMIAAQTPGAPAPSAPANTGAAADGQRNYSDGARGGWWGGAFQRPTEPWQPQDWDEASAFMKEHCPERFRVIDSLSDGRPRKNRLIGLAVVAYHNLQRIQKDDPELGLIVVRRMELEDSAFGLATQFRDARADGDTATQESIRVKIQQKVADLVDTNLKERQRRIARLEKSLKLQQDQLATDLKNRDMTIDRRMRNLVDGPRSPEEEAHSTTTQPATTDQVGSAQP